MLWPHRLLARPEYTWGWSERPRGITCGPEEHRTARENATRTRENRKLEVGRHAKKRTLKDTLKKKQTYIETFWRGYTWPRPATPTADAISIFRTAEIADICQTGQVGCSGAARRRKKCRKSILAVFEIL